MPTSGKLFEAVQKAHIFPDDKTFVDAIPIRKLDDSVPEDLATFVRENFILPKEETLPQIEALDMYDYIGKLWPHLIRPMKAASEYDTLISLPYPHVVPGGRFREMYYWDTYFACIAFPQSLIKRHVENLAHLIGIYGFIPNGNRTYYLSRSHPPFFSHIISLLDDPSPYHEHLAKEYEFWKNRQTYFDTEDTPRPEAFTKDQAHFREIRASAESGWDFSSRFFLDPSNFDTINTTSITPIDLHSLLYHMEKTLGLPTRSLDQFWDGDFFYDLPHTKRPTLAGLFPLFVKAASKTQADLVAKKVEECFLKPGGLVTTLNESGQQWDYPNGWAPLQWVAIVGLRNYGHTRLAHKIAIRWLSMCEELFQKHGTLFEKYNVVTRSIDIAQGEYELQQGFAWTNGVNAALRQLEKEL